MLRVHQSQSAEAARSYYVSGLSREDYYSQGQKIVGSWGGRAAERLGLEGQVSQDDFNSMVDNQHPRSGGSLTPRTRSDRTIGYDFVFSVPKSVSIAYELTGDERILDVFDRSVRKTMEEAEPEMKTRVDTNGQKSERTTGNLTWAEFNHFTARPIDGKSDMHLHKHVYVFNSTFDEKEQRFKAGQFRDLKRDAPYWEAAFHARMAKGLTELGYGVQRNGRDYGIAGVKEQTVDKFSRRTAEIEAKAEALGMEYAEDKASLGAKTRVTESEKSKEVTRDQLRKEWDSRLTHQERLALQSLTDEQGDADPKISIKEAVNYGIDDSFSHVSVEDEKRVMATALRRGLGSVTVDGVKQEFAKRDIIHAEINGRKVITTKEVLAEEKAMIAFARNGRGQHQPLVAGDLKIRRTFLSGEQQDAVKHAVQSSDRVVAIRGGAGVGKTTLMQEAVEQLEKAGHKVHAFAPSAQASRGVLREEGFGDAETVAKLLHDERQQNQIAGGVIWIDEAGTLGVKNMNRVFQIAEEQNARVLLTGDTLQHGSVDRGDSLRILETHAGIQPADVKDIRRQSDEYKEAVQAISGGNIVDGFDKLDDLGWVHEIDNNTRHEVLAKDYLEAIDKRQTALVVSPTHAEGEKVSNLIRAGLKKRNKLGKEERDFERLQKVSLKNAGKEDHVNYKKGQVVQFHQHTPGFKSGSRATVIGKRKGEVFVSNAAGERVALPLQHADRFDLFESSSVAFSPRDEIRITRNGKTADRKHSLNNGSVHQIKSLLPNGDVVTKDGWVIPADYGHFTHAYVTTSYASQGSTKQRVFLAEGSESFAASDRESFYVSVSRGRKKVDIYTDSKTDLRESIVRSGQRVAAVELNREEVMEQQRQSRFREHLDRLRQHAQKWKGYPSQAKESAQRKMESWAERYGKTREQGFQKPQLGTEGPEV